MLRTIISALSAFALISVVPAVAAPAESAYLLQFRTTLSDAQRHQLKGLGVRLGVFVQDGTYVARMTSTSRVSRLSYVREVRPFQAQPQIAALGGSSTYLIALAEQDERDQKIVADKVKSLGGKVVEVSTSREHIMAVLDAGQVAQVAKLPAVIAVDPVSAPETDMDKSRESSGANHVETAGGYRGQGVRGEVMDGGFRLTHQEFRARPPVQHTANSTDTSHGTSTFGQIFASGVSPTRRGLLPEGQGITAVYNSGDRYAHTKQLVDPAGQYRAVFQSNSWGDSLTTKYTAVSQQMDRIVFDHDILICQSQSNAGSQSSRPQAWAKNVLSVGGHYHYNTLDRTDDKWNRGASIGPAADGRIKPELSNYYDQIDTTSSSNDTSYTASFGGTSGATPITCGNAGLMFQMWADGVFDGGPGKGRDVFAARPHAATAKALLINTANQHPFIGAAHDQTRTHQGWGTASVRNLYDRAKAGGWKLPVLVNETDLVTTGQTRKYTVTTDGKTPLRATLAYTDPAGSPTATKATVNDLSLKVTAPDGTVYWGNYGLDAGNWSLAGGAANTVDTVENVLVDAADAGTWTVEVIATAVNVDGHVETAATDADYALVVS
ncbi:S8 family serine peptidase [Lentzea kentuckyensis]|uniref:S8 family serine peptidase n=1 Tax=Lentzea kentuckyensis TaxID=360086 RepID=UPI001FE68540|nr:S8 family serine peptidase [Lentzea kentuckyensis]